MSGEKPTMTPDGLVCYEQEGIGLVVSASEHNHRVTEIIRGAKMLAENATEWKSRAEAAEALVAELRKGAKCVLSLMSDSYGVSGLHLNGEVACWNTLRTGGRYEEWLEPFESSLAKTPADMGAELAELRADKARLDWMDQYRPWVHNQCSGFSSGPYWGLAPQGSPTIYGATFRASIDAAMQAGKEAQ